MIRSNIIFKKKKTLIMGILNITPDSFSDGGLYYRLPDAFKQVENMVRQGVDIIDIGGESTRPGSLSISVEEELRRVLPIIKKIRQKFGKTILLSIDTNKSKVAEVAIKNGVNIVNALGGFTFDPLLADIVAKYNVPIIIYHIRGEPSNMQSSKIPYKNVISEINTFFRKQIVFGNKKGIKKKQFILDPGVGFGKSAEDNIIIIKKFRSFMVFRLPLLIGVSRKSHLGKILQEKLSLSVIPNPTERLEASLAETAVAVLGGASIVRTHDVFATKKFLAILDELK